MMVTLGHPELSQTALTPNRHFDVRVCNVLFASLGTLVWTEVFAKQDKRK